MNKTFKTLLLIICIVFAAFSVVSCTGGDNAQTEQSTEPTEEALPSLGKFVVVVPKSSDADYAQGNEIAKQKIIETIAQERGVAIDFEVIEISKDNFINELNELLVSGISIDAISVDYDMFTTFAGIEGLIKPIDSLLSSSGANLYAAIGESYWEAAMYNGAIYGVPSLPYPEQSIMVTRSDIAYMFTTKPITTYSSLLALCKFYKNAGYEYPLAITWDQLIDIMAYSFSISPEPYTHTQREQAFIMREEDGDYTSVFLDEIKLLYDEGFINPNLFSATEDEMKAEFMAGRAAIYVTEYSDVFSDRLMLKSTFPDAELKVIAPLISRWNSNMTLSGEEKTDRVLMFTQSGQNSEALMTYLDWAYSSQLNHTMLELGAYGTQLMYNPVENEYYYLGDYSPDNKPYNGLYTFGLATEMLYTSPSYVEYTNDIMAQNTLKKEVQEYLSGTTCKFPVTVELNDTAKTALAEYTGIVTTASQQYIKGEITIDDYAQYQRNIRNSGLLATLTQEIGVAYLYKIGALD